MLSGGGRSFLNGSFSRMVSISLTESATISGAVEMPFLRGFLCNLLNVKVVLLLAALSSTFLDKHQSQGWVLALWLVIVLQGWVLWIAWSVLLSFRAVMAIHARHGRWMDGLFAGGLVLVALRVLFAGP